MQKIIYKKEDLNTRITVTVTHPEFGYVIFDNISARQADVLTRYNSLIIKENGKISKK